MVSGKFKHKGRGIAREGFGLLQHDARKDDGKHTDEVGAGCNPPCTAKNSTCNHGDEGKLGAAGHKGCGDDRHATVGQIFNRAACHDAGD